MLLADFIAAYARPDLRRVTREGHLVSLRLLHAVVRGGSLKGVRRAHVLSMVEAATAKGMQRSTIAKHVRYIGAAFAYAIRMGYCTDNPARDIGIKNVHRPKGWEYVRGDEVSALLSKIGDPHLRAAVALARWAGCRINEALRVQWGDIDFDCKTITIRPTPDDWGREEEGTKGKLRVVPLDPRVPAMLPARGDSECVCGSLAFRDHRRMLKRVATWPGQPWHTLRKSCGMDWADKVPISTVADWMGHSVVVASKYYLKPHAQHFAAITEIMSIPVDTGVEAVRI
jgi:integrase